MYHNGDNSISPVYLIQNVGNGAEWMENLAIIEPKIIKRNKITFSDKIVRELPWKENTNECFEGTWVISDLDILEYKDNTGDQIKL